jgi:Ca2+-binding RTX toxin-like protein
MAIFNGDNGNNTLLGGDDDDILNGRAGNDTLQGRDGNDTLDGGDDDDVLEGEGSNDTLSGGNGNDILDGGDGDDFLDGGDGDDQLVGSSSGIDTLNGGLGNDIYIVDRADDIIINEDPDAGFDIVESSVTWTLSDNLEQLILVGNDAINGTGNALDNSLLGNNANNYLFGGEGNDGLQGLDGDDTLDGGAGADTLRGGPGNDVYIVGSDDVIVESDGLTGGIDTVESFVSWKLGDSLENLILIGFTSVNNPINGTGNELDNTITGNDSNNILSGKQGNDTLLGGGGDDRIVGGIGDDILTGGDGADRFYRWRSDTGVDTITDFQVGEDKLCFSARGFGGDLAKGGVLGEEQFSLGISATTESNRFIYDTDTGNLFFDIDGTGDTQQVQIATLSSGLAMTNADIFIFA